MFKRKNLELSGRNLSSREGISAILVRIKLETSLSILNGAFSTFIIKNKQLLLGDSCEDNDIPYNVSWKTSISLNVLELLEECLMIIAQSNIRFHEICKVARV